MWDDRRSILIFQNWTEAAEQEDFTQKVMLNYQDLERTTAFNGVILAEIGALREITSHTRPTQLFPPRIQPAWAEEEASWMFPCRPPLLPSLGIVQH